MRTLATLCALLALPSVAFSQGAHYDNSPGDLTGGGVVSGTVYLDCATSPCMLTQTDPTSDVAPKEIMVATADSYPFATGGNVNGGSLYLRGGLGSRTITVTNYAIAAGDTITFSISTVAASLTTTTLTEGVDFACATSNNVCASALAVAVDALAGVSASASGAIVGIVPDATAMWVSVGAPADGAADGVFATRTSGTDGQVLLPMGTITRPSLALSAYPTTGFSYVASANRMCAGAAAATYFCWGGNLVALAKPLDVGSQYVYSFGAVLKLGSTAVSGHSLGQDDVVVAGALEVNGAAYLDGAFKDVGATCTLGEIAIDTGGATIEFCACTAANTWNCAALAAGPAD